MNDRVDLRFISRNLGVEAFQYALDEPLRLFVVG